MKQVGPSTVLIRHQTSGAEKIVNVELVKTDVPLPADAEAEERPVELQCQEEASGDQYVVELGTDGPACDVPAPNGNRAGLDLRDRTQLRHPSRYDT